MGLFITTLAQATRHAVYAIERSNPTAIQAEGNGTVGMVGQFPWGPDGQIIQPTDSSDRLLTVAPPGMDHTGSAYMCMSGKAWPDLRLVRVLGSAAAAAVGALQNAVPTTIANVTAKYKGTAGNSIVGIVKDATDNDANHFDLDVQVTGASGTTTDVFQNINFSGVGADSVVDCSQARLVASIAKAATGRPVNGTYAFASGANGTINSGRYLGTPGNADFGLALFEGDPEIDIVFTDDPGNTDRAAVNSGLLAHQILKGDRVVVMNGPQGQTPSAARTNAALNQGTGAFYVDSWFYQKDEIDGTERLVSPACALASVMANLPASTSAAWKSDVVQAKLAFISRLEFNRGDAAGTASAAGVCTLIKEIGGGYTFEAFVNTSAPVAPTKKNGTRTRMGIFIAKSLQRSLRPNVDAPNVPTVQNDVIGATQTFMDSLKTAATTNPLGLEHVADWGWGDMEQANLTSDLDAGRFTLPLDIKTSSQMEQILLSVQYGENVVVKFAA